MARTDTDTDTDAALAAMRRTSSKIVQVTFAVISLVALAMGLAINWFAASVELTTEMVEIAAFGMLLTAVAHALALCLWERR
jgi:hypothetical protein